MPGSVCAPATQDRFFAGSHAGVAARMFRLLAAEGINIQAITTSEIKVSCVFATKYTELAVRALHDGFGLAEKK